jgi:cytoskeleton protein RodZ
MKMTGELLRAERIKQDLKITDVAFALKLSTKIVQAIEDGDEALLPAKTFIRGFVKSYAEFLKLDSVIVLKQFQEEMGSTSPVPKAPPPQPIQKNEKLKSSATKEIPTVIDEKISTGLTRQHIIIFILVTAAISIISLINGIVHKYSKERAEVSANISTEKIATNSFSKVASTDTQPQQAYSINTQLLNQTVPKSTDVTAAAIEKNEPEIVSEKLIDSAKKPLSPTEYPKIETSNGKPVEVLIEAKKDLTLQYAKGSSIIFEKILMKQNTYQIIRSTNGLHIRADDGSNLILTVNGSVKPINKSKPLQVTF